MKRIVLIIAAFYLSFSLYAQQNQTLYFMSVPQANITNPALYGPCKLTISGLLIPVSGQLMPPLYLNYNNNGFSYKQFIHHGNGLMSDSLIFDFPNLIDKMRRVNYLSFETHIPWINVSYIWRNWYFSFGVNERINAMLSLPKDLVVLAWEGNGKSLLGQDAFLNFLGANINWHREYAIGAATSINSKWTVGARAKLLFGKANLWFKNNQLTWNTNKDDFSYTFDADMEVHSSQPFFDITKFQYDDVNDSLMFEMDTLINMDNVDFNTIKKQVIFNAKNKGVALDLGAKYIFNNKITLYGSLLDVGFIRYKQNADGLKAKGNFYFDGWDIQPYFQKDDSVIKAHADAFRDSVIKLFDPTLINKTYNYWLPSRLYLGGTYQLTEKYNVGALFRGEFYLKRIHAALTLSGNAKFTKWLSTSVSYTVQNNSFTNVGLGFAMKFGFYQWYMVSDNVMGFIWPQSSRNFNLRMGLNMIFGCKKKENSTMLNTNFVQ
ncbi:MAG TPA: DUF5723 family protein [Bacteroidales bacterium]|nr:DUF5723 family protein [Bacteroidales bacterium]